MRNILIISVLQLFTILGYSQVNILQMEQLTVKDGLPQNSVQSIKQDKFGFMWFSSLAGLSRYDGYTFKQYLPEPDNPRAILSRGVYNLIKDTAGNIWIAFIDTTMLCKYNYETDDFTRYYSSEVDQYIKDMVDRNQQNALVAENSPGYVWEYMDDMLVKTNEATGNEIWYCLKIPFNQSLSSELIKVMYLDSYGTLWFGTENQGAFKVNTNTKPFYSFFKDDNKCSGLIDDIIRAVYESKNGIVWIGTQHNGVIRYNRNTNNYEFIRHDPVYENSSLINNQIRAIFEDEKGNIWIGTKGGLSIYNTITKKFINYHVYSLNPIPHNWVHGIISDHKGTIWIGTFNGFARYNPENGSFTSYPPTEYLLNSRVSQLIEDNNTNIWVATQGGGVTCLKREGNSDEFTPKHYINVPNDSNTISSNRVFALLEDEDGYIWATTDYGLNRIDPGSGLVSRITMKDGLRNEIIVSILSDYNGHLWLGHKRGLTRLNRESLKMRHYTEKDGLISDDFSENAFYRNPETGEMFFGSIYGINSFFPSEIEDNYILPDIVFTDLQVLNQDVVPNEVIDGKVILSKSILYTKEISLNYRHKSFSIGFAALHYVDPNTYKYKFMLEGFDKDWVLTDATHRRATYSNLTPGKYTFKVLASNSDGMWTQEPATMKFIVHPPWWTTTWAYIGYFIIIFGMLFSIYQYVISKERLKNQVRYEQMKARKLAELDQMKLQFFTNVSHELRTPLSLIIDPLRKLSKGLIEPVRVHDYYLIMYQNAKRLMKLVNQLLDFRRIENQKYDLEFHEADIAAYIGNVADAFRINALHRNIKFSYTANPDSLMTKFDPDKLEKILFNLLSNAFKYTQDKGEIELSLDLVKHNVDTNGQTRFIEIKVKDNGIGIPSQSIPKIFDIFYQARMPEGFKNEGTGVGLAFTKELVELHKGNIEVVSKENVGTTFIVKLPLQQYETEVIVQKSKVKSNNSLLVTFDNENEDETTDKSPKSNSNFPNQFGKPVVLIVEDNIDVRTYLRNELADNYNLLEAGNGKEGWRLILENVPDIIISDIMMPKVDGLELCKKVKSDLRTSHIPVLLLTARQSDKFVSEGYETGADAYITKPFSTLVLSSRIKNLVESRKNLSSVFGKMPFIDIKKIAGNSADESFINKAIDEIEKNIQEPEFNIDLLADNLKLNRRQLTHKIKTLTGQTVNEFVKTVRLNKAAELLLTTDQTVSEIAFSLGYNVPANFSRSFTKQFGKNPTEYVASVLEKKYP